MKEYDEPPSSPLSSPQPSSEEKTKEKNGDEQKESEERKKSEPYRFGTQLSLSEDPATGSLPSPLILTLPNSLLLSIFLNFLLFLSLAIIMWQKLPRRSSLCPLDVPLYPFPPISTISAYLIDFSSNLYGRAPLDARAPRRRHGATRSQRYGATVLLAGVTAPPRSRPPHFPSTDHFPLPASLL